MTRLVCALGPDCAGDVVTSVLTSATTSLDAAVYEVGASYRWALTDAAAKGVAVRLLLDRHSSDGNAATAARVQRSGGECRVPAGAARAHAKLLIADAGTVAVGTGNLLWRDAPRHPRGSEAPLAGTREWWAVVRGSADLVGQAGAHFEAAWTRATQAPAAWADAGAATPPPVGAPAPQAPPLSIEVAPSCVRLIAGGHEIAIALSALIGAAASRVAVIAPYIAARSAGARALLEQLAGARQRGVDARLLLGRLPEWREQAALAGAGLEMRAMGGAHGTSGHAKGLVVDGTAVVMSANWSGSGLGSNFEVAMLIDHPDAASYYAAAWARDWDVADPLPGVWPPSAGDILAP